MAATGQIGNQEQPWENVIDFQCMPNSLNANQFLTASARDQTIELARQVQFMTSPFKQAFLQLRKLKKLQIDDGVFSFETAALFPPVENLTIRSLLSPDPTDMLNEDQLNHIRTLKLNKTYHCTTKIEKILRTLIAAPLLIKLELDMNRSLTNRQLGSFIANCAL